jgi:hypothetical protein
LGDILFSVYHIEDMGTVITTLFSFAGGALVTWLVSRRYYIKAGRQLQEESEKLHKLTKLILKAFEEMGIEFNKDATGAFKGIVRNASAGIGIGMKLNVKSDTEHKKLHRSETRESAEQ